MREKAGFNLLAIAWIWQNVMNAVKYIYSKISLGFEIICETVWNWFNLMDSNFQNWVEVVMAYFGSLLN